MIEVRVYCERDCPNEAFDWVQGTNGWVPVSNTWAWNSELNKYQRTTMISIPGICPTCQKVMEDV